MTLDPASFFVTGGALSSEAPSYVPRRADRELLEALRIGEFCYVLTARQMGKSSLMVRTVAQLRAVSVDAAVIDLTAIGLQVTAEQWYRGLLTELGEQLGLEEELRASWQEHLEVAPTQRWLRSLRDLFKPKRDRPLVIFIDEIDAVRSLPFPTHDFFAAIREVYNRRAREPRLQLTFCLLGVASPTDLIAEPTLTPFNVGRRIELSDFTEAEASRLTLGLGRPPALAEAMLRRVLFWTGAHPYLTQRLCQAVALDARVSNAAQVDRCCHDLFLSPQARDRDDNLVFVREQLLTESGTQTALLALYSAVLRGQAPREDARVSPIVSSLQLSGIVTSQSGVLNVRNRIYEQVFDRAWVDRHLPDAEVRRQRAAYRRGVLRASGLFTMALVGVLAVAGVLLYQRTQLRVEQAINRRLLYGAEINLAAQAWEAASATRVADLLARQMPPAGLADLRGFEWFHLWWLLHGDPRGISSKVDNTTALAYSPNGRSVAVAGWVGGIEVWDARTKRVTAHFESDEQKHIQDVAFSPDGALLVSVGDLSVLLWDLPATRLDSKLTGHEQRVLAAALSHDGRLLATGSADRTIRLWDVAERRQRTILRGHRSWVNAVRFSPDGSRLASAGSDSTVRLWDVRRAVELTALPHAADVADVVFTADGRYIVSAGWDAAVNVWDASTLQRIRQMEGHTSLITALADSPNGQSVASSGVDGTVRLWDLETGRERSRIRAGAGRYMRAIGYAPDGRQLLTLSDTGVLRFWDVVDREVAQEARTLRGHTAHVTVVELSPDESRIVTGSRDGTARVWKTETGEQLAVLRHAGIVNTARFSPDGTLIVTADDASGEMTTWAAETGHRLRAIRGPAPIAVPLFTPDGLTLIGICGSSTIVKWNVQTGAVESQVETGVDDLGRVSGISPDGSTLVTATSAGVVRFWSLPSLRQRGQSQEHTSLVSSIQFSPDGRVMATGSFDGSVRLWDWRAGTVSAVLTGHQGWIGSIAFSPDGLRMVTGGQDGTVKFWSVMDRQDLVSFQRHRELVSGLTFSRDGRMLVSSGGPIVRVWRAASRDEKP